MNLSMYELMRINRWTRVRYPPPPPMYNPVVIVYLINLERAKDRLSSAKEAFNKVGLNYNLEIAVDGKDNSASS